jgi:hypothetical protein
MLEGLKRWFSGAPATAGQGQDPVVAWAQKQQYAYRQVQDEGFVIDGKHEGTAWRMEWGPSQRPYVDGQELRLRAELGLPADLQLVLMNRQLQDRMERAVFEQYVEGVQTRIDNQTPPEMRWLVMFPKLGSAEMGPLREHFVALASHKPWLTAWLRGPLAETLVAHAPDPAVPLVLMIGRGRLMLRTALAAPEAHALQAWLAVFETALQQTQRAGAEAGAGPGANVWSSSALPDDERKA